MASSIQTQFPSYEYWDCRVREGDPVIWRHLHSMEDGNRRRILLKSMFAAMDKADLNNRFRLYQAFPDKFNPQGMQVLISSRYAGDQHY